jgi:hypothetical protein
MLVNGVRELLLYDSNQSLLGYVSENGFVYDSERTLLGYVSHQGVVRNIHLHSVGHIDLMKYGFPFVAGRIAFFLLIGKNERECANDAIPADEKSTNGES